MAAELLRRGVHDHRRALAGWCLGVAAYVVVLAAIFLRSRARPDSASCSRATRRPSSPSSGSPEGWTLTTGAGFVDGEFFSLMLPLLAIALAIGSGARTLAGEEDSGRLELVFASLGSPARRRAGERSGGGSRGRASRGRLHRPRAGQLAFGLDLPFGRLAGGLLGIGALALLHGWLSLAVGAARPSRLATGIPSALAVGAYLIGGPRPRLLARSARFVSSFWWVARRRSRTASNGGISPWSPPWLSPPSSRPGR